MKNEIAQCTCKNTKRDAAFQYLQPATFGRTFRLAQEPRLVVTKDSDLVDSFVLRYWLWKF